MCAFGVLWLSCEALAAPKPLLGAHDDTHPDPNRLAKNGLAKNGLVQIGLAKTGLAKVGPFTRTAPCRV